MINFILELQVVVHRIFIIKGHSALIAVNLHINPRHIFSNSLQIIDLFCKEFDHEFIIKQLSRHRWDLQDQFKLDPFSLILI